MPEDTNVDLQKIYRTLFQVLPDGCALHESVYDDKGNPVDYVFLEINDAFSKITGLKRESIIGKKVSEVIPNISEDKFDWIKAYGDLAKKGTGMIEVEQYSEALKKWYNVRALGLTNKRFLAIFRDITEEKEKGNNLLKLKTAIDNALEQMLITDVEGIITYTNKAAEKITGYKLSEIIGTKAGKLWSSPMPKSYYESLWKTIKIDKKDFVSEIVNKRKNGEAYTAKISISPIFENEELIGFVGIENDVTDIKLSEKSLKEKVADMEKLNSLMVGREIKMTELKKEIEDLRDKLRKYEN